VQSALSIHDVAVSITVLYNMYYSCGNFVKKSQFICWL